MGVIRNIKASIDDKSSMSVNSITLLASALMGVIVGLVMCFVLVYDVIELYRVWVDYVVYTLLMQQAVTEEYYSVQTDGSYWLEPLGRRVLIQSLNDYLEETIDVRGQVRSREYQIFLYVQHLAQQFKRHE